MKRSRPTKQAKPDAVGESNNNPTDHERAELKKDGQSLNALVVEDEEWIAFEWALSRLKEALGTKDEGFCKGILRQLKGLIPVGHWGDQTDFEFVLSVLADSKPVDKLHAMLVVQMAICNLAVMKQAQILLKPVRFELPVDLKLAMHNAMWDPSPIDKQKIKIDDLPVRQAGERAVTRLMQTYALLLQTSAAYQKSAEASVKVQHVFAIANGQGHLTSSTEAAPNKRQETAVAPSSWGLNGSRQPAASISGSPKEQINAIDVKKSNGRASP